MVRTGDHCIDFNGDSAIFIPGFRRKKLPYRLDDIFVYGHGSDFTDNFIGHPITALAGNKLGKPFSRFLVVHSVLIIKNIKIDDKDYFLYGFLKV